MIVLDTNVLSELMKAAPAEPVTTWVAAHPAMSLYTTTITQAEILYGVAILPGGKRRDALRQAVEALFDLDLLGRVLPFDSAAAAAYAEIAGARRQAGRPISQLDAQIAAIARSRGAAVATRNAADFEGCGVRVHDPWAGARP